MKLQLIEKIDKECVCACESTVLGRERKWTTQLGIHRIDLEVSLTDISWHIIWLINPINADV